MKSKPIPWVKTCAFSLVVWGGCGWLPPRPVRIKQANRRQNKQAANQRVTPVDDIPHSQKLYHKPLVHLLAWL